MEPNQDHLIQNERALLLNPWQLPWKCAGGLALVRLIPWNFYLLRVLPPGQPPAINLQQEGK